MGLSRRDIFKWITGAIIAPVAPEKVVAAVEVAAPVIAPVVAAIKPMTQLDKWFLEDAERMQKEIEAMMRNRERVCSLLKK
jgi:hypothetical protein